MNETPFAIYVLQSLVMRVLFLTVGLKLEQSRGGPHQRDLTFKFGSVRCSDLIPGITHQMFELFHELNRTGVIICTAKS